jgi:hypothetical protein
MTSLLRLIACIHVCASFAMTSSAARGAAPPPPATAPANGLTVAILDFDANTPGNPELGKQIGETLTAVLTGEPGFTLIDRASVNRTLQEHELGLTGLVNPDQAAQIGKLVGAKILVVGKAFMLDKQIFVTAKVIGTETSLVEGVLVKGDKNADTASLVIDLSHKLAEKLRQSGPKLVAAPETAPDPMVALQAKLKGRALPKIGVIIAERHASAARSAPSDPAVDTEIKMLLNQAGFTIVEGDEKDWARQGVEVVVSGEAFSEAATRIGNIISCSGRAELKLINRRDGKVLLATRTTARAADLSEQIAAKTALQKAGRTLGLQVLEYFASQPAGAAATTKP